MSNAKADWVDLNTGINDEFTGIVFRGDTGVVSGRGLYYTTNGGVGPSSWSRFEIIGNTADSSVYEATKFLHCFSRESDVNNVFACGVDTVQNKAVVFQLSLTNFTHSILYVGSTNSQLNNIAFSASSNDYFSVGSNGLIVQFDDGQTAVEHSTVLTQDLTSISFFNNEFWIGANGHEIHGTDDNPGITITTNTPATFWDITDVLKVSSTEAVGTGNLNFVRSGNFTSALANYDHLEFTPLDAQCIYKMSNVYFIGTPHGIFRTVLGIAPSSNNPYEIQLSSLQKDIREFWSTPTMNGTFYACGADGVILESNFANLGGDTKPYVRVSQGGNNGCVDQFTYLTGHKGSSTGCQWFINGNYVSAGCNGTNQYFDSAGVYNIMYVGNNGTTTDTAYYAQIISSIPEINKPVSLFDSILCQSEPLQVFVDSSEIDVKYGLYSTVTNDYFGSSSAGNGGTINFTSSNVSEEGYYYLIAEASVNSNCFDAFTDSIFVEVEKTHADLHPSHINAEVGENVTFFENCTDADNYAWTFSSAAATLPTSSLANPVNSFSLPSLPEPVELICWSNNGCYDSVIKDGPRVIDLPLAIDTTWVNANESPDVNAYPAIIDMIPVSDGYIIAGRFGEETFASRFGDSITLSGLGGFGGYLLKYDFRGVLKWNVTSDGIIKNVAEDSLGNIFFTAQFSEFFVDNQNDTIFIADAIQGWPSGVLVKLDSLGGHVWNVSSNFYYPEKVYIDNSGDIVLSCILGGNPGWEIPLYFNGVVSSDTLHVKGNGDRKFTVLKFDQSGSLKWEVMICMTYINKAHITKISFDDNDNVYVTGIYEGKLMTFPTDLPDSVVANSFLNATGGSMFLTKLDSLGQFGWQARSYTDDGLTVRGTHVYDMVTDSDGNSYITGKNKNGPGFNTGPHLFENVNGSITTGSAGKFFLMKVNTLGNCEWIKTGDQSSFGIGNRLLLDGDHIVVTGWLGVTGNNPWVPVKFQNDDGTAFEVADAVPNYFIAEYDSTGYVHSMFVNSQDMNVGVSGIYFQYPVEHFGGFFKHVDESYYIVRNIKIQGGPVYNEFGIPKTTVGRDTWVVKFKRASGFEVPMIYYSEVDTTVCDGSSFQTPSGNTIVVTTNLSDTTLLVAQNGADSTIVTNISVSTTYNSNENVQTCDGGTIIYPDGTSEIISGPTTHTSFLTSVFGCDSIINTNVTLTNPSTGTLNEMACIGSEFIFDDGTVLVINSPIVHSYVMQTAAGCDSTTHVYVDPFPPLSPTISEHGDTLNADPINLSTYQWISCENSVQVISGATSPTFIPATPGFYAVIVSDANCTDTSDCQYYALAGMDEESPLTSFNFYPNPTKGSVVIKFDGLEEINLIMTDVYGRKVKTWKGVKSDDQLLFEDLASGIYQMSSDEHDIQLRVIKLDE